MDWEAMKIQTIDIKLEPKAGTLAKVYGAFKEADVDIVASWGYQMGPGEAAAHFYTDDIEEAKTVLTKMGLKPTINNAVWVEGEDETGIYFDVLSKVAKAGVNLEATDAFSVNGNFATVLFANEKDYAALCKALKI
jgi:hypothetical protein